MKKLMFLGGNRGIVPVIEKAHQLGCYVITCDYRPDNYAHRFSDEYVNLSVIDKDAVLKMSQEKQIDGICSFACDPGATTAAYVAEKMGLPFQGSYESVKILQHKGLFRKFLSDNGFCCPHARTYDCIADGLRDIDYFCWPVIVKPVDSAGSKGITKVETANALPEAIKRAMTMSLSGKYIIEDFLTIQGYRSTADCFTVNGELQFCPFSDQMFDLNASNPYNPSLEVWPSSMSLVHQQMLQKELQRLMTLLNMKTGIYNVETCIGINGEPYIMEVSPRGGGNKIAEIQHMATGVDLIEAEVRSSLGLPIATMSPPVYNGVWCTVVLHGKPGQEGIFKGIDLEKSVETTYVKMLDLSVEKGDYVGQFDSADKYLGNAFLRFSTREELQAVMSRQDEWMQIHIERPV